MTTKTAPVWLRLDPADIARLDKIAKARHWSRAWLLRVLIREALSGRSTSAWIGAHVNRESA